MGKCVSITEASEITGLSMSALRRGVKSGRFPYIRVGSDRGTLLFDIELLEQTIKQEAKSNMRANKTPVKRAGV